MLSTTRTLIAGLAAAMALGATVAAAEDYPSKTIRFVVPYSPGGASDVSSRIVAKHLADELGQEIVIVNVNGAGGAVGWNQVRAAKPDGYTITMWADPMAVQEATGASNLSSEEFAPISQFGRMYLTVFTLGDKGDYPDLEALRQAAAKEPGKISLAMGRGTPAQFAAARFEKALGEDLNLVNVGGGAEKKAAVMGGHVSAGIEPMPGIIGPHQSGQLTVVAVLSDDRIDGFDAPTANEQGAALTAFNTYGLIAPKGTPQERIEVLDDAMAALQQDDAFKQELAKVYVDFVYEDSEAWGKTMEQIREATLELGKELGF